VKANGQEKVDSAVRDAMKKRLLELAQKMSQLVRDEGKEQNPVMLFAVDAHGRVIGAANFDRQNLIKDETFELGGFPVVVEAMRGWLRDDTWCSIATRCTAWWRAQWSRHRTRAPSAPSLRCAGSTTPSRTSSRTARAPPSSSTSPHPTRTASPSWARRTGEVGRLVEGFTVDGKILDSDKFYNGDAGPRR